MTTPAIVGRLLTGGSCSPDAWPDRGCSFTLDPVPKTLDGIIGISADTRPRRVMGHKSKSPIGQLEGWSHVRIDSPRVQEARNLVPASELAPVAGRCGVAQLAERPSDRGLPHGGCHDVTAGAGSIPAAAVGSSSYRGVPEPPQTELRGAGQRTRAGRPALVSIPPPGRRASGRRRP